MNEMKESAPGRNKARTRDIRVAFEELQVNVTQSVKSLLEKQVNVWEESVKIS